MYLQIKLLLIWQNFESLDTVSQPTRFKEIYLQILYNADPQFDIQNQLRH